METLQTTTLKFLESMAEHPYLPAIFYTLAFLLLASAIDRICSRLLLRFLTGIDSTTGSRIVALFHRPVFTTVILIGILLAINSLRFEGATGFWAIAVLNTLLVLIWTILAYRLFSLSLRAMVGSERLFKIVHPSTAPLFGNGFAVLLFLLGSYLIMSIWGIDITGLVASAGILGLALSFAAQDTLSNLFAGISILADRPYEIGDYIVLDSGDRGEVTHIGLRSTRLLTRDDVAVTIPNGVIAGAKIINETAGPRNKYRVRVKVGVAYDSDVARIMDILEEVAREHDEVLATPVPRVRFRTFADSSINLELLCWITHPTDRGRLVHELNFAVFNAFRELGVKIPFPQREITIKGALP